MATPDRRANVFQNSEMGARANPVMPSPDAHDDTFAKAANAVLAEAADLIRDLVQCHQSAIAIVVQQDWTTVRKHFSLSPKYAAWANYNTPATGYGSHGWLLRQRQTVRLTQAELEAHPEWRGFGTEAGKHPPMRGWLATPLLDSSGVNWGLLQASDKYDGEFTAVDQASFERLALLVAQTLEALWTVRVLRQGKTSGATSAHPTP
jgi:GAF domain-containing protein